MSQYKASDMVLNEISGLTPRMTSDTSITPRFPSFATHIGDGCIEHKYKDDLDRLVVEHINTKEQATRDALISLGWTPPGEGG